jgi:transposase
MLMKRFIEGENRFQSTLFPERLDDYIADDNAVRVVDARELELFSAKLVAIGGSKFKAVNSRDKNFTRKSVKRRIKKTQANIDRYLAKLDAVDEEEPEIRAVTADELKQERDAMRQRKALVEHPFGSLKHAMGATHFLTKRLPSVKAEMSLHILAYNMKRAIKVLGAEKIINALQPA